MLLRLGKKIKIIFYVSIIFFLSSINNYNLDRINLLQVKQIDVVGLSYQNSIKLKNNIKSVLGKNIFFIKKDIKNYFEERNDIKNYSIQKIYPDKLKVNIKKAKGICLIIANKEQMILGDNGKILTNSSNTKYLPRAIGSSDTIKIFQVYNMLKVSRLDISNIKSIYFYKIERFDIEFKNKLIIKFPIIYSQETINYAAHVIKDNLFKNVNIIDLRVSNKIITYEE